MPDTAKIVSLDQHRDIAPWTHADPELWSQAKLQNEAAMRIASRTRADLESRGAALKAGMSAIAERLTASASSMKTPFMPGPWQAWLDYARDRSERMVLTLDALRLRGDRFFEHQAAGEPPVLIYDYEIIMDGADLPRPCNYVLLRILPQSGVAVHEWKRPYVIIDPRAGHGPGIGGFKPDSQVGVALSDGHPVYFVAFRPMPEPGQTLASVTHAEAAFLREVKRRHPKAAAPIVVGNCQGGWATAILAATNPDLAGPIVLNGAPMSYWSGRLGQDLMRYNGGLFGGVLPVLLMSDLGAGVFDGANLVSNFESLNPGRTWFRKYYDLFSEVDTGVDRFLEFERWWGGFYLMNEAEIRWIVENLFVGNKLAKGEARLETGRPINLKAIRAPIIVFASHGDNITPPQQALNWIVDAYADESEIEILGQRIIYMVHDQVGHLGIFVSSAVAQKEHAQMASTLKTIEALAPGLYEMEIDDIVGEGQNKRFTVSFHKRRMNDILALGAGRGEEPAFGAVAHLSEWLAESYDWTIRPAVQRLVSPEAAQAMRAAHPIRVKRAAFASRNPLMAPVAHAAERVRVDRHLAAEDNPFVIAEKLGADMIEQAWNTLAETRAFWFESTFLALYANPWGRWFGSKHVELRARKSRDELRALPMVIDALHNAERGGLREAVIRMLILLADSRGNVRRDRLERSAELLTSKPPFSTMDAAARARTIHEQTLIARFADDLALSTLPKLLHDKRERAKAMDMVEFVVGAAAEMEPRTLDLIGRMRAFLELPPLAEVEAAE